MSTRSAIARKTAAGFDGVYHHWDGYPSGLGATLYNVRNRFYQGDTDRMLRFLIDANPGGWSTINKDWSKPSGRRPDSDLAICKECLRPTWEHYRQYYRAGYGPELSHWERAGRPEIPTDDPTLIMVLGHEAETDEEQTGPESAGGKDGLVTEQNASDCGCEWAYVFDGKDTMEIWASFCDPVGAHSGQKMIGMFGCGDPKAEWRAIAKVNLNAPAPDWRKIEQLEMSAAA